MDLKCDLNQWKQITIWWIKSVYLSLLTMCGSSPFSHWISLLQMMASPVSVYNSNAMDTHISSVSVKTMLHYHDYANKITFFNWPNFLNWLSVHFELTSCPPWLGCAADLQRFPQDGAVSRCDSAAGGGQNHRYTVSLDLYSAEIIFLHLQFSFCSRCTTELVTLSVLALHPFTP